jgi:hypothetical protein
VECRLLKPTSLLLERRPHSLSADVLFHFGWRVVYRLGWVGLFHMATHAHDVTPPPLPSVRLIFAWTMSLCGLCRLVLPVLPCPLFGTPAHVARLPFGSAHRTFPFAVRSMPIARRLLVCSGGHLSCRPAYTVVPPGWAIVRTVALLSAGRRVAHALPM